MIHGAATIPAATIAARIESMAPSTTPAVCSASSLAVPVDRIDHDRHQHGLQRTRGEQLEEDVRYRVGGLVDVAQVGGAQHRGHHDHPGEAR